MIDIYAWLCLDALAACYPGSRRTRAAASVGAAGTTTSMPSAQSYAARAARRLALSICLQEGHLRHWLAWLSKGRPTAVASRSPPSAAATSAHAWRACATDYVQCDMVASPPRTRLGCACSGSNATPHCGTPGSRVSECILFFDGFVQFLGEKYRMVIIALQRLRIETIKYS